MRRDLRGARRPRRYSVRVLSVVLLTAAFTLMGAGCSRRYFRDRADADVVATLTQKNKFDAWPIEQWHIYPNAAARFADPTNPDRPPMPPDDEPTQLLSPNPQKPGKPGIGLPAGDGYLKVMADWDAQNRAELAARKKERDDKADQKSDDDVLPVAHQEKADDKKPLADPGPPAGGPAAAYGRGKGPNDAPANPYDIDPANPPPTPFRLKLEQASELALFNSREFQDVRESLYLAALPVTFERFSFAAQFFATGEAIREVTGRETPEGRGNRWRANTDVGFSKLFSTGALLLFRFANRTVVELGNLPDSVTSVSTATLDITQPLLRGGGREVTLEPLTQVERNLLYAIRAYARFRKEFAVFIAAGGGQAAGGGVSFSFGRFGDSGFAGPIFSGIQAGAAGYLPTLLVASLLANERENVAALERSLTLFRGFAEGPDISGLQVDQVELDLLQAQSTVLQREQDVRDALDNFKLQLGLPTNLALELDDGPLKPLADHLNRFQETFDQFDQARVEANSFGEPDRAKELRSRFRRLFAEAAIVRGTRFRETFPPRWAVWEKRTDEQIETGLRDLNRERRGLLDRKTEFEVGNKPVPEELTRRLDEIETETDLGEFEQFLRGYERETWRKREARSQGLQFRDAVNGFMQVLTDARTERLGQIREQWPELPPLCVGGVDLLKASLDKSYTAVSQAALTNRFDLMNARASLVDSWRQIAVQANSLLGVFNVQYLLNASSPADEARPLAVGGSRTRHQLILNGELPLVRRLERNNYRTSLINFQRQRRALMASEDFILNDVRSELRQLRVLSENYKIQQRAVELAYAQVESSLDVIQAPPQPVPAGGGGGGGNQGTAAALTTQLLQAQRRLVQAKNALFSVWVNYQVARMTLYRDIELMPLDDRGVWIDEVTRECPCRPDPADRRQRPPGDDPGRPERLPEPRELPGRPADLPEPNGVAAPAVPGTARLDGPPVWDDRFWRAPPAPVQAAPK